MHAEVYADKVHQSEHGCLRNPQRSPQHGVRLLDGEAVVNRRLERPLDEIDAEPVAYETRRIVAHDYPLPEAPVGEAAQPVVHRVIYLGGGDYLEQGEVARWVEEVGDKEARGHSGGHALDQFRPREGRGVRRHDGVRSDVL